jgi:hypothetical protein
MASKKQTLISRPLARTANVVVEAVGDETVIYDTDAHVAHALKPLAAAVYAYADGKNTPAEIAELASYRLASTITESDVVDALEQLDAQALLDGPVLDVHTGVSRRTALKTFAAAGAGSMLVMSVATAAAQACTTCTTVPTNQTCNSAGIGQAGPGSADCYTCNSPSQCGSSGVCCCVPCEDQTGSYGGKCGSGYSTCCQTVCVTSASHTCPKGTTTLDYSKNVGTSQDPFYCPPSSGGWKRSGTSSVCCTT